VLLDAVAAALGASDQVAAALPEAGAARPEEPPPPAVMDRLRQGLGASAAAAVDADHTLRLAEAIRILALRHGPAAVEHCCRLVESLRTLLDAVTGTTEARP
jgi:two-component system, NtrC family, nitrogen regulation response regulator NtrX